MSSQVGVVAETKVVGEGIGHFLDRWDVEYLTEVTESDTVGLDALVVAFPKEQMLTLLEDVAGQDLPPIIIFCDDVADLVVARVAALDGYGVIDTEQPELLPLAVTAALNGYDLVPHGALIGRPTVDGLVAEQEIEYLILLESGTTVRALAESAGYSERQMHRILRRIYLRLGVGNRSEALEKLRPGVAV